MRTLTDRLEAQFEASFDMLAAQIDACPDTLWPARAGGFAFWQQLLHALCGTGFWLRPEGEEYAEPFAERGLHPELDGEGGLPASREELRELAREVRARAGRFFAGIDDGGLALRSAASPRLTLLDIASTQLRHLMYHVGALDSVLRDRGEKAVAWLEPGLD
jgi:hypothetical protein